MLSKSQVKYIQSLCHKKFRDEYSSFLAEGPKLAQEFLVQNRLAVEQVYALESWITSNETLLKHLPAAQLTAVSAIELEKISALTTPNQVLMVVRQPLQTGPPDPHTQLVLALDGIQDPGNLGTIIRTADWFGISAIACSPDCADTFNPKVVQATMGSIARVALWYSDLSAWLSSLNNVTVMAAVLEGMPLHKAPKVPAGVLLIGNESKGISDALLSCANKRITIPRIGAAESLNAAVATGIILAHLKF
jgi:RNA methyltransferase, TrmH family